MIITPKINNPIRIEPKSEGANTANITKNITVSGFCLMKLAMESIIAEKIFIIYLHNKRF